MAKILVVDDDELVRYSLARVLSSAGHEVIEAADGVTGLRKFRASRPELVVTDIVMPEQDGLGLLNELRRIDQKTPIMVISGGGEIAGTDFLLLAEKLGANDILAKPFDNSVLLGKVATLLAGNSGG
jgi:DNA-binding response OmpR family regulator